MDAVVFDMDGVLVDSERHWHSVECSFLGSILGSWSESDQQSILGRSIHDIFDMLRSERGLTLGRDEFIRRYQGLADEIYGVHTEMIPGAREFLSAVVASGIPTALASSSPMSWITIVLDKFDLRDLLPVVSSGDEVPGRGKPAPDIYLLATSKLGFSPRRCVAIEDSSKGVLAAKSAGLWCIGFRNGFNDAQDLSAADHLCHSFSSLSIARLRELTT